MSAKLRLTVTFEPRDDALDLDAVERAVGDLVGALRRASEADRAGDVDACARASLEALPAFRFLARSETTERVDPAALGRALAAALQTRARRLH